MPLPPPTLLIVDDDVSNLESLQRIFQRPQTEAQAQAPAVLTAPGGKEALEILRKQRIDVLLCDLMMPAVSGMDLLKAVQTLSPETVVILMTAYGTVETAVEAMKDG